MFPAVRHHHRTAVIVGFIALMLVAASGIRAQKPVTGVAHPPDPAPALLAMVDAHYNHLTSLQTHYTERYSGLGMNRTETGTLLLKKPGRMLWRYDSPKGKVFVLDGKYAWFYTPGDAQASRAPAKQLDDLRTPLRFLLGHTELRKELDHIVLIPDDNGCRIVGVPHGMQNRLKQLTIRITRAGQITAMRLEEVDGASTQFDFDQMQENIPAKDSDFVFNAPPGVSVMDAMPPI